MVYDDNELESNEYFSLCLPNLRNNKDVQLVTSGTPDCLHISIHDNEGIC